MNPRTFINFLRSRTGTVLVFLILMALLLTLVISKRQRTRDARDEKVATTRKAERPQLVETIKRSFSPLRTPQAEPTPTKAAAPKQPAKAVETGLPPLSLFAETPVAQPKIPSEKAAPYGRLVACELVVTVDSSSIQTPIIGLVTADVFYNGELILPAGTEVHGNAQVDRARERISSDGRWTIVWQNGEQLSVSGIALDREPDDEIGGWGINDGSAGLRGRLIKSDNLAEIKLFAASLLSGAAEAITVTERTAFGSVAAPVLQNAPVEGAQRVLDRYADQVMRTIERDGFYVRVPAGKEFYLYITQAFDGADALRSLASSEIPPPVAERVIAPEPEPFRRSPGASLRFRNTTTPTLRP